MSYFPVLYLFLLILCFMPCSLYHAGNFLLRHSSSSSFPDTHTKHVTIGLNIIRAPTWYSINALSF